MNQSEYLDDDGVIDFLDWAADLVGGRRVLHTQWHSPQGSGFTFRCYSLWEAYEKYRWPMTGAAKGFAETARMFEQWQQVMSDRALWRASPAGAPNTFREAAIEVALWGGMSQVKNELEGMGRPEMDVLFANAKLLDPVSGDEDRKLLMEAGMRYMGSGYSKIYAMMLNSFPIYDSRVACALTSLIRVYCLNQNLRSVPDLLRLGVMPGRDKPRNPSDDRYEFPVIRRGTKYGRARHASSNLRTAWLLNRLGEREGKNGGWPEGREALAIQSALFMVGYREFGKEALPRR